MSGQGGQNAMHHLKLEPRITPGGIDAARRRMLPGLAQVAPPQTEQARAANRPARNEPCPCGSGMKFKRCCA
jgi:hypothetical protein